MTYRAKVVFWVIYNERTPVLSLIKLLPEKKQLWDLSGLNEYLRYAHCFGRLGKHSSTDGPQPSIWSQHQFPTNSSQCNFTGPLHIRLIPRVIPSFKRLLWALPPAISSALRPSPRPVCMLAAQVIRQRQPAHCRYQRGSAHHLETLHQPPIFTESHSPSFPSIHRITWDG